MSQVVPRPNAVAHSIVALRTTWRRSTRARNSIQSLEAYIAGRVATEARSAREGGGITRARFKDAPRTNIDWAATAFLPPSLTGSRAVDVVAVDRTGRIIG
jgi:hypothetical protein